MKIGVTTSLLKVPIGFKMYPLSVALHAIICVMSWMCSLKYCDACASCSFRDNCLEARLPGRT